MDVLTLASAKKYAKALVEAMGGDVEELERAIEAIEDNVGDLTDDVSIVNLDGDLASELLINALRQHIWQNESEKLICEEGSVTLTNTGSFPFNNSQQTVALVKTQKNTKYAVIPEDPVLGNVGDIVVSGKQTNGFKIEFTGSAKTATVKYIVIGGIIE